MELEGLTQRHEFVARLVPHRQQLKLELFDDFGRGQDAARKLGGHVERAVNEIAEVVRQLAIVAHQELLDRELAVLAYIHFANEEVAEGIDAKLIDQIEWIDRRARALGHLGSTLHPKPVHQQGLWRWQAEGMQHDGPVNGMRRDENVFADNIEISRPESLVDDTGVVIQQRVEPHVRHVVGVEWQRDAPLETFPRTRNTEVVQRLFKELEHLLLPVLGEDKILMRLQVIDEPVLILLQPEEIVLLHDRGDLAENLRPRAIGQAVFLLKKLLLPRAIETAVFGLIDFALVEELLQDIADDFFVSWLGRADEVVVGNIEAVIQCAELRGRGIDVGLGLDPLLARTCLHFLAVLVGTREKVHLIAHLPPEPGNDVRQHLFVGMAQVWRTVHIVDGGRDVERLHVEPTNKSRGSGNVESFAARPFRVVSAPKL